jgi:hypothetical protein
MPLLEESGLSFAANERKSCSVRQPIRQPRKIQEQIMRMSSLLRTATLALSLIAATGAMSAAFAGTNGTAPAQQSNTGVYDNPDFIAPLSALSY